MPATTFLGRRWQVPTDVLPFFAIFGAVLHCIWLLYITIAVFITAKVTTCDNTRVGRSYLSVVCLFFVLYVVSLFTEIAMAVIGLRGEASTCLASHSQASAAVTASAAVKFQCKQSPVQCRHPIRSIQKALDTAVSLHTAHQLGATVGTVRCTTASPIFWVGICVASCRGLFLLINTPGSAKEFHCAGWGTYVVSQLSPEETCWQNKNRQVVLKIFIYASWGMIMILSW